MKEEDMASRQPTADSRQHAERRADLCPEVCAPHGSDGLSTVSASAVRCPLSAVRSPADVKALPEAALPVLAQELRERMVAVVSKTGGHLAPSLGTVELTLALCRVFDFPRDKVLWDVGHQAYAWKMLTGRNAAFDTLRTFGGLRGFPLPAESPYDTSIGGHAGVALSTALGFAAARDRAPDPATREQHIIAVVGDASLTNGISLEALNALRHTTERLILVINDNGMSISKNVGAFSRLLARRLSGLRYNRIRAAAEAAGHRLNLFRTKHVYRALKAALKPLLLRQRSAIFEDLGIRYLGPIDGHDLPALTAALQTARESRVPIALHIATVKGKGYAPAERNPAKWHGVAPWAKGTQPLSTAHPSWSTSFGNALLARAADPRLVAITAAMRDGTGLSDWFRLHPTRAFDVGICEEHAVTFAAGLAAAGLRPVVALYSTFAQRAVDSVMHDICLPALPVILCLDRAGIVGSDGPTHHGLYDIAMLRALPNLTLVAPCDEPGLARALDEALARATPTVIRYPRGATPSPLPPDLPRTPSAYPPSTPLLLALGTTYAWAREAFPEPLPGRAPAVLPVEAIKPLPDFLPELNGRAVITLEDASAAGGFGAAIAEHHQGPHLLLGWPDEPIAQGSEAELRHAYGLDAPALRRRVAAFLAALEDDR